MGDSTHWHSLVCGGRTAFTKGMKGYIHSIKGQVQIVAWEEIAGKVLSAKTIQRIPVKKSWLKHKTKGTDLLLS